MRSIWKLSEHNDYIRHLHILPTHIPRTSEPGRDHEPHILTDSGHRTQEAALLHSLYQAFTAEEKFEQLEQLLDSYPTAIPLTGPLIDPSPPAHRSTD